MAAPEADSLPEGPPSGDFDVPPAIACAQCGKTSCEGCAPEPDEFASHSQQIATLPWERDDPGSHERLLETSELTAVQPRYAFGRLGSGSVKQALGFALLCEIWAIGSFTLLWAGTFYALFPFAAQEMLSSQTVILVGSAILVGLIAFVVFVHALWGVGLEWGVRRAGGQANFNLGLRFGLYACGWDLLTSPAGLWFQVRRSGFTQGLKNVRASTRAPRPSTNAYLDECRRLDPTQRRSAVWTAVWLGLAGVGLSGLLLFAGLLFAWLPWVF